MTEARDLLMNMARSDESGKVRGQALFWLAQHGGAEVAALIDQVLANGVSDSEMEQAIFSLSQMPEEQGLDRLIEIARSHENSKARERALFWLGQKAGARAVAAIWPSNRRWIPRLRSRNKLFSRSVNCRKTRVFPYS